MPSIWGVTPRESIEAECARRGRTAVVDDCVALLLGEPPSADVLQTLAGPGAGRYAGTGVYWVRVWALRGLLWAWEPRAAPSVCRALGDEHWRVREMALKVVARHLVGDAFSAVVGLREDPVPRVRRTAERALVRLTAADV